MQVNVINEESKIIKCIYIVSRIFVEADCLAIVFKGKTELERTSGLLDRFRKSVPKFCPGKI